MSAGRAVSSDRAHVVILGSGKSILSLSAEDRAFINQCDARIALNKFGAFTDIAGIEPTHIFFLDSYEQSCRNILQHIFAQAIKLGQEGVTFVVSTELRGKCVTCDDSRRSLLETAAYFSQLEHDPFLWRQLPDFAGNSDAFLTPSGCILHFREHHEWRSGGHWATSSTDPLFHFRGSLTSAINYATVEFPGAVIWLVGADFRDGGYFFDDALARITYRWQDWTTAETRLSEAHTSVRTICGATMLDAFPVVLDEVEKSGSTLFCTNTQSLFVQHGLVPWHEFTRALPHGPSSQHSVEHGLSKWCVSLSRRFIDLAKDAQHTRAELQLSQAELHRTQAELRAILESPAWKVTAPLRSFRSWRARWYE